MRYVIGNHTSIAVHRHQPEAFMGKVVTAGSPRHRVPVSCNPVDHPVVSPWRRLAPVRTKILGNFDNPALRVDDRGMLQRLVSACELIESNWSGVEKICDGLPRMLVHGDLGRKNLRLRHDEAGTAIVAFDWECSGWSIPAADIYLLRNATRTALPSYRSAISEYTHALDDQIRLLLVMANGFRLLACADWASSDLSHIQPQAGVTTCTCMSNRCGSGARGWPRPILSAGERQ